MERTAPAKAPRNKCATGFLKLASVCEAVSLHPLFMVASAAMIILSSLIVGLQTDAAYEDMYLVRVFDVAVKWYFTVELVIRLLRWGLQPWFFFTSQIWPPQPKMWNIFDTIVVAAILSEAEAVAVLRLFRILRLFRLLNDIPPLQLLLRGLRESVSSIAWVGLLLLLVFYVYGIIGVLIFKEQDREHFGNLGLSLVGLFRVATGDSWTSVMYPLIFVCKNDFEDESAPQVVYPECMSLHDDSWIVVAYFFSFILLSSMCALNLMVGVILGGMSKPLVNEENEEISKFLEFQANLRRFLHMSPPDPMTEEPTAKSAFRELSTMLATQIEDLLLLQANLGQLKPYLVPRLPRSRISELRGSERPLGQVPVKTFIKLEMARLKDDRRLPSRQLPPTTWFGSVLERGAKISSKIVYCRLGRGFVNLAVLVTVAVAGIRTYEAFESPKWDIVEDTITIVFAVEIGLKIIAEGRRPWMLFFESLHAPHTVINWFNVFDVFVVLMCMFDFEEVAVLRLLRLLRIVKLLGAFPNLQILVAGFFMSLSSIVYIFLLLLLIFYVFGIVGIMLFRSNDPVHFRSIGVTFLTLFQCATGDSWASTVMVVSLWGCDHDPAVYPQRHCLEPSAHPITAPMYFVSFVFITALVVLNLIIGTIDVSMNTVREQRLAKQREADEAQQMHHCDANGTPTSQCDHALTLDLMTKTLARGQQIYGSISERVVTFKRSVIATELQNGLRSIQAATIVDDDDSVDAARAESSTPATPVASSAQTVARFIAGLEDYFRESSLGRKMSLSGTTLPRFPSPPPSPRTKEPLTPPTEEFFHPRFSPGSPVKVPSQGLPPLGRAEGGTPHRPPPLFSSGSSTLFPSSASPVRHHDRRLSGSATPPPTFEPGLRPSADFVYVPPLAKAVSDADLTAFTPCASPLAVDVSPLNRGLPLIFPLTPLHASISPAHSATFSTVQLERAISGVEASSSSRPTEIISPPYLYSVSCAAPDNASSPRMVEMGVM